MSVVEIKVWVGVELAVLLVATQALAQQPTSAQQAAIRSACRADYQARCESVPSGGSAALQCLVQNAPSLSPACQHALSAVQGGTRSAPPAASDQGYSGLSPSHGTASPPPATMRQACGTDYRRYCRGIPLGGSRALACLHSNQDRLSQSCRGALAAMQSRLNR